METIPFYGWQNCIRLSNDLIELIVTTDVGPRIIHFGFLDSHNEFATVPDQLGQVGGDTWRIYGGHRFWHAPEHPERTYYPDNETVAVKQDGPSVTFTQPVESTTQLQKSLSITIAPDKARVQVEHHLQNHSLWAVETAPWALSVMAAGGTGIMPLPARGSHEANLLPNTQLNLWAYTDMSDPRYGWGEKYIRLEQEPGNGKNQKIGLFAPDGWLAYVREGHLFVKTFDADSSQRYPDQNSNAELFICDFMQEVETLGPVVRLEPGDTATHIERWALFDDVSTPGSDNDIDLNVLPHVQTMLTR